MGVVKILYLGRLADAAGRRETCVDLPDEVRDTEDLVRWIDAGISQEVRRHAVRIVVNSALVHGTAPIQPGDEIAFLPPTSGG